ncbi:hypothetical protein BJ165DRAFT_1451951 [Panaeolus papilionaceus]|nr:hypothetical protein BJ165DRAFT_1451951 [Panaeolus papilionaceus]
MKHGSSSHVPPQGVPVHIQWSSAKGEDAVMTSTLCTDIDNSELEYEDERSSNEDPGWVKVNPESQPKKRDVSPVATKAARRPRLVTHSVVDSHSPNDTEKQSALLDLSLYNNNRLLERRARPRLSLLTWRQARRVERKSKTAPAPHCPQPNPQPSEDVVFASSCSSGTSNKHLDQQQPRTSIAGRPYLSRAEPDTQFERLDSTKFIESHKPVKSLSLGLGYGSHPLPIRSEVTSERPMDAARLGPRPKIQFNTRRDPDAGAPSNWGLHEDTSFKHPSLSINSWILGAARLPSSVKMVITHDSAWYGILDDQSLRRAHQVRLAIEHHELEATDSDAIQSLYSICVTPARMALYLEPKERWAGTVPLGMVRRVEATVAALSTDERAVFEYLLGPYGFSHLSSAMFNFRRWGQISKLKSELTTGQTRAVPSPTFDTLQQLDYHPTRPVTVEVLVQVFKGEITAREAYDRNSIGELRKTLQSAGDDEDSTQKILRKLANALLNRALEFNDKDSVEEAIFYYQHLEPSTSTESIEYLELILGFCTAHYFRHQLLRMRDDLDSLFKYLDIQSSHDFGAMLRRLGERPE